MVDIERAKEFIKIRDELYKQGVIGIPFFEDSIHVRLDVLLDVENIKIEEERGPLIKYPYKISARIDGITFFALADDIKLHEFMKKRKERKEKNEIV